MDYSYTKKEIAEIAGMTSKQLYNLDRELPEEKKLFVRLEDGKYDLPVFVKRWVDFNVSRATNEKNSLASAKTKHELIKTQKTELEVQRLRGSLVDVQDIEKLWGKIVNDVMQNMLNIPKKVAPTITMMDSIETIAGILDTEIRSVLNDIADTPLPDYLDDIPELDEEGEE